MNYDFTPPWNRPHRVRWTDEGYICDAGEDCHICEAQDEDEDEDEEEQEDDE